MQDSGTWFETLKDLTPKALESGMLRLKQLNGAKTFMDYPPNCLQFRALCLAFYEELGLPKASEAFKEIRMKEYSSNQYWSHKVVKYIASHLPQDFLMMEQEREAYVLFERLYYEVCNLVRQGHQIPEPGEPNLLTIKPNFEVGKQHLRMIKQQLGVA